MLSAFILNHTANPLNSIHARRCLLSGCRVPQKWRLWRHLQLFESILCQILIFVPATSSFLMFLSVRFQRPPSRSTVDGWWGWASTSGEMWMSQSGVIMKNKPTCCCSSHMCLMFMFVNVCVITSALSDGESGYQANSRISRPALASARLKQP